jgi:hypothetical protein
MPSPNVLLTSSTGESTWVVFSHPNHELAIFGLLQRLRPNLIYLTDGGGDARVAETRRGLEAIGIAPRAHFLNHTEQSFYDALVRVDEKFFLDVVQEVRAHWSAPPIQVLCDAVEFYNPVHDLSLPIVAAALRGLSAAIFEMPLIHQSSLTPETYVMQRTTAEREARQVIVALTKAELEAKRHAREKIYTLLRRQLGSSWDAIDDILGLEALVPADMGRLGEPRGILRYERRAQLLKQRGEIVTEITHLGNFMPIVRALTKESA